MNMWRFVSNQNSSIFGINDAGIETFSSNALNSLVREAIQNSLDAQLNEKEPVKVKFKINKVEAYNFPDAEGMKNVLEKCLQSNPDEEDAIGFFENAIELMNRPIKYLKISDYNTTGLSGADTCEKGTVWSRLIKENGSSNKQKTSGGSFGIGKAATFAVSDLRTVFYSSYDNKGVRSNIGVAKLVSFFDEDSDYWTTGTGYFSNDEKFKAILGEFILGSEGVRMESGTDIYVMGFHEQDDSTQEIIKSILVNFLVSIWKGNLIVYVDNDIVDKISLNKYITTLNRYESNDIKDTINYYKLLMEQDDSVQIIQLDSNEYGKQFGFEDNSCVLYLMEGNDLNSRIMMTRKAGMKLFNQGRISGTIDFTGILMIKGELMNKEFKKMEVPSHDSWQPGRCKGSERRAEKIYKELRDYLRLKVKEYFAVAVDEQIDAFGAGDFLPDINDDDGTSDDIVNTLESELKDIRVREMKITQSDNQKVDAKINTEPEGKNKREGKGKGKRGKKNGGVDGGKDKGFKFIKLDQRLICSDKSEGKYILKYIVPNNAKKSYFDIIVKGEQSDNSLNVLKANVNKGNISIIEINKNRFYMSNNIQSDIVEIELMADINQYCMMEMRYYEKKR